MIMALSCRNVTFAVDGAGDVRCVALLVARASLPAPGRPEIACLRAPEVVGVVAGAEACRLDDVDRQLEAVADAAGQVGVAAEGHGGAARLPPPAHQVDGSEG